MSVRGCLGAVVAFVAQLASVPAGAAPPVVRYDAGRVTVHADRARLPKIVDDLARETGATLRGTAPDREVTLDLDGVPVGDALARLLGKDNFAVTYAADGTVRAIEVLRAGEPDSASPLRSVPGTSFLETETSPEYPQEVMSRTVEVHGRLARAVGSERPTAGQLIHASLRVRSGKVRAEAQARVLEAFARDPEIEDVFSRTLSAIDDATLARMLRGMGGSRGEQFMAALAARARSAELRAKAAAVLERLRTTSESAG